MTNNDKKAILRNEIKTICEVAIQAFQKYKPHDWNQGQLNLWFNGYNRFIDDANKYNTLIDLKSVKHDALVYFQEAPATTDNVKYFWSHERIVPFAIPRVDPLEKILKKENDYKFQKTILLLLSFFATFSTYCQEKADTLKTLIVPELSYTLRYPDSLHVVKDEDMHKKMEETKEKYFKADSNVNLKTMKALLGLKTRSGGQFNITLKYLHNTNPMNDADRKKMAKRLTDMYSKYGLTDVDISAVKIDSVPFMSVFISVKPFDGSPINYIEEYSCLSGHNALFIAMKYFKEEDKNIFYDILYSSKFN